MVIRTANRGINPFTREPIRSRTELIQVLDNLERQRHGNPPEWEGFSDSESDSEPSEDSEDESGDSISDPENPVGEFVNGRWVQYEQPDEDDPQYWDEADPEDFEEYALAQERRRQQQMRIFDRWDLENMYARYPERYPGGLPPEQPRERGWSDYLNRF